jgi:hypothetical protein
MLDRHGRRTDLDEASLVDAVTQFLIECVRTRPVVTAGDLNPMTVGLPCKGLCGLHKRTPNTSPLLILPHGECGETCHVARCVEQGQDVDADDAHYASGGINC